MSDLSSLADPYIKEVADALREAREEEESRYGLPVDDFPLTLGLNVIAEWQPGFPGDSEQPEEYAGYEISRIMCKGKDITFLFDEADLERLQMELLD